MASKSYEEPLDHLKQVLGKLKSALLILEKTHFFQKEVTFLGHILCVEGIKADPEKVGAIRNFPVPKFCVVFKTCSPMRYDTTL